MKRQMEQFFLDAVDTMVKVREPTIGMNWRPARKSTQPGESCMHQEAASTPATHFTQGVDTAPPSPLAPRTPEERDSLPLTPPCREMAGVDSGRSEESLGWNVVRNTPPDNIASGKPRIRDLTERGRPRRPAKDPPCQDFKGVLLETVQDTQP